MFYWEAAWIPVEYAYDENGNLVDDIYSSNKVKWEANGSGWASSYASEYDPDDAGAWYGGSAVDNQAWFDFNGKALETVNLYNYIRTGTTVKPEVTSVDVADVTVELKDIASISLPETATVKYNTGDSIECSVTWNSEQVDAAVAAGIGTYTIDGTYELDGEEKSISLTLTINPTNLLANAGFEDGLNDWIVENNYFNTTDASSNSRTGSGCLHFYSGTEGVSSTASQTVTVDSGIYNAGAFLQGGAAGNSDIFAIKVTVGEETYTDYGSVSGWKNWTNPTVNDIVVKEDNTELTVTLLISDLTAGVWGSFDDVSLCRTGDYEPSIEEPTEEPDEPSIDEPTEEPDEPSIDEPTDDGKDIVEHIHQKVEKVVKKVVSEVKKIIKNIFGKWFK